VGEFPRRIEVFTTSAFPVTGKDTITQGVPDGGIELHVFALDGLRRIDARLSDGLPAEPEYARRTALNRIQQLDGAARTRMQNAAMGLARALEYRIDRYPAIVFDGRSVVYGVTDLHQALQLYQAWRTGAGS
jgi:integrating conjugative element protein (TIGR03757 family)